MKTIQSASVCGLGKLGACVAATLAERGIDTIGVDIDPEIVRRINDGQPPVKEPLLAETIAASKRRLRATVNHREVVPTDVSIISAEVTKISVNSYITMRAADTSR